VKDMKKDLNQAQHDLGWARLSFQMSLTSFLLSTAQLLRAVLAYGTTVLDMTWSRLKSSLGFHMAPSE